MQFMDFAAIISSVTSNDEMADVDCFTCAGKDNLQGISPVEAPSLPVWEMCTVNN